MYGGPFISPKIMRAPIQPSDVAICSILWFESFSLKKKSFQNRLTEPLWSWTADLSLWPSSLWPTSSSCSLSSSMSSTNGATCSSKTIRSVIGVLKKNCIRQHKTLQWNYIDIFKPDWTSIESFLGCQKCQRNNVWTFFDGLSLNSTSIKSI